MSIKKIICKIEEIDIETIFDDTFISNIQKEKLSQSEIKLLSNKISRFRELRVIDVFKCIFIFALVEPDVAIDVARKKGVFRYKAWGLNENSALFLLKELRKNKNLNFSTSTLEYIDSKIKLSWIFDFYKEAETKIVNFIKKHHKKRFKTTSFGVLFEETLYKELLAYDDLLFINKQPLNTANNKDNLYGYSHEEISESISYLIYLCQTNINYSHLSIPIVIPEFVKSKNIEEVILLGCKVCALQEWEALLDYFPYRLRIADRVYTIYAENDIYDKSMRMGYVNSIIQSQLSFARKDIYFSDVQALGELSTIFNNHNIDFIKEVGHGNLSRYRIEIPEIVFQKTFENTDAFFKEEMLEIQHFAKEFNMPIQDLLNKKITENCTLKDVILFKRVFAVFNYVACGQLLSQKNENKIISSLLPSFSESELVNIVGKLVGSNQKATELITLFTYNKNYKLDVQYTPLLKHFDFITLPLFLTMKSNFLRNCIAQSYIVKNQIVNQEDKEFLVLRLKDVLENNHPEFKVFINKSFKYNNQKGEIDVILITENSIFLFECKAPLEPTNNFELRATSDHINKAAKQLTSSLKAFSNCEFRKNYLQSLGIENKTRNIYTCIVMGNRLFDGISISSHPIRYISELDMIINNGVIYSNVGQWNCWKEATFTENDLIDFLSENNDLHKANFDAMVGFKEYMHIKGNKIELSTYIFDSYKAIKNYDSCFSIISRDHKKFSDIEAKIQKYRHNPCI